nr:ferredoxin-type protein NapF [uncultured Dongia sp.]
MAAQDSARSRRAFLTGQSAATMATAKSHAPRPPWTLPESAFAAACTGCGECVTACPEGILYIDDSKLAAVDFRRGGNLCTFCGACAAICAEPAFLVATAREAEAPWHLRAAIGEACLTHAGVMCQSCKDACGDGAIRFVYGASRIPGPDIDLARCTGCGACAAPCPAEAITIFELEPIHAS